MKTTASFFISFIYLLASFTADALEYTSSASTVSEVVPGPGLPSLESLGLTSADLHMANDDTNTCMPPSTPIFFPLPKASLTLLKQTP